MALTRKIKSGLTQASFDTYIGEIGQIFFNNDTGEIRISDGVTPKGRPVYVAVTNANIGNLVITGASIESLNTNEDLNLVTNGTGNVNVYGSFLVHTDGLSSGVSFDVAPTGFTTITVPTITTGDNGLLINGGTGTSMSVPQVAGTTMRLVGNDGVTNTLAIDAFGAGTFPGTINRAGRGTSAAPTATKNGDTIGRWGAVGYGNTNFVIDTGLGRAASDIRFVATEDFTDSHGGTQIQFYTSPNGGTVRTLSVTMDYTGITTGNIHSTNVFVSGNTISTGTTQAIGNFTANGTSNLIGTVTAQGQLNVIGNFTGNGTSIMLGTTQAIGNFTANGTSNLIGNVLMAGTANVAGVFTANGVSNLIGIVNTSGNLTVAGNINIVGTSINTGTTLMVGNTTTEGTTTLIGDVSITGNVNTTGASANFGQSIFTGQVDVVGPMFINNQISITALGNIKFNDGTVQTTSAIQNVVNAGHITGSLNNVGAVKTLNLTSDATPSNTAGTIVSRGATGDIAVGNITATNISTTSVTGNAQIAGSMTIYGNLNVVGTTVTTNAVVTTVDTKTFTIASNAVSTIAMDGAAYLIGNIGGHSTADWTYDDAQTAWRTNISVVPATTLDGQNLGSETRQWGNLYVGEAYISGKINVGVTPNIDYTTVAQFTSNVNEFSQVYAQNLSSNIHASTDFVAANDVGGSMNNYIDIGINSSTYNDVDYNIGKANDGYLYINGGNLTVGTQSTGMDVVFHTDGTTADKEAGRIHLGRWILGGVDNGTDKFQVTGTATISGNVTVGNISATNLTNKFNAITANAASLQNQITGANAAIVTANTAMKGYVDAVTTAWTSNAATQETEISGLRANITASNAAIVTANSAVVSYVNSLNSAMVANITASNVSIGTNATNIATLNANVGAYHTWANAAVNSLATGANANTAGYLSNGISTNIITTGNVNAGNVNVGATTYANLSITSTATAADFTIGQVGATGNLVLNRNTNFAKDARITGNLTAGNISVNSSGTLSTPRVVINDGGLRIVNSGTTLTIDFSADSRILWYVPSGDTTITLSNYTAGAEVEVMVRMGAAGRNIALGIAGVNNSTTGTTSLTGHGVGSQYGANQAVSLVYTCYDNTQANCYVRSSYA